MLIRYDASVGGKISSCCSIGESCCLYRYLTSIIWLRKSVLFNRLLRSDCNDFFRLGSLSNLDILNHFPFIVAYSCFTFSPFILKKEKAQNVTVDDLLNQAFFPIISIKFIFF